MTQYRICTVGRDGRFTGPAQVAECANDQEAVERAIQAANGLVIEIWDYKRFVARLAGDLGCTHTRTAAPL
jgi:hypothetical protein